MLLFLFVVCPALQNPENGHVYYSNQQRTVGTIATYSCKSVLMTTGNEERQCQINGMWSGSAPTCTSEYILDVMLDTLTESSNQHYISTK